MIKRKINTQTEAEKTERLNQIKGIEWGVDTAPPPKPDPRIASGADSYTIPNHGKPWKGAPTSAQITRQIAERKTSGTELDSAGDWGTAEMKQEIENQRQVAETGQQSEWAEFQEFKRQKAEAEASKETNDDSNEAESQAPEGVPSNEGKKAVEASE